MVRRRPPDPMAALSSGASPQSFDSRQYRAHHFHLEPIALPHGVSDGLDDPIRSFPWHGSPFRDLRHLEETHAICHQPALK